MHPNCSGESAEEGSGDRRPRRADARRLRKRRLRFCRMDEDRRTVRPAMVSEHAPRRTRRQRLYRSAVVPSARLDRGCRSRQTGEPAKPSQQCGLRDTGTLDFGTGFDCFDTLSETKNPKIAAQAAANRRTLVEAMRNAGFRNYAKEWWHFTLEKEPFPKPGSISR